jgi:8-oxo-dGTP diphosphatase
MMEAIRIRVAGILIQNGNILLVRHEKNKQSYWLLPGGGIQYGETAEEALRREFREEVGLSIQVGKLVLVHDSIPPDRHRQVLNLYFLVSSEQSEIKVTPDQVLRDASFQSLGGLSGIPLRPHVTEEIIDGIAAQWEGNCHYLGNRWRDKESGDEFSNG